MIINKVNLFLNRIGFARIGSLLFLIVTMGINVLSNQNPCVSQKNDIIDMFEFNTLNFGDNTTSTTLNYVCFVIALIKISQ